MSADQFLADLFEFELCAECGGDAPHHTPLPILGNWFARCDCPMADDCEAFHPTVSAWRSANGYNVTPC